MLLFSRSAPARLVNPYLQFQETNFFLKKLNTSEHLQNWKLGQNAYRIFDHVVVKFKHPQTRIFLQHFCNSFCTLHNTASNSECNVGGTLWVIPNTKLTSSPKSALFSCSFSMVELPISMSHRHCEQECEYNVKPQVLDNDQLYCQLLLSVICLREEVGHHKS